MTTPYLVEVTVYCKALPEHRYIIYATPEGATKFMNSGFPGTRPTQLESGDTLELTANNLEDFRAILRWFDENTIDTLIA